MRCRECGARYRVLADEVGEHDCPRCGYDPTDDDDQAEKNDNEGSDEPMSTSVISAPVHQFKTLAAAAGVVSVSSGDLRCDLATFGTRSGDPGLLSMFGPPEDDLAAMIHDQVQVHGAFVCQDTFAVAIMPGYQLGFRRWTFHTPTSQLAGSPSRSDGTNG